MKFTNISFIGGIHGVGKSTICNAICVSVGYKHLSASEVLKWAEINSDKHNKKVSDISLTQNKLIFGLQQTILNTEKYLLDGHFCLLDSKNKITKIPFATFETINPQSLHLVVGDAIEIKNRLESRDGKSYDLRLLEGMQQMELDYAIEISNKLGISLSRIKNGNYDRTIEILAKV